MYTRRVRDDAAQKAPRWLRLPFVRAVFDAAYLRADRVLDTGQHRVFRLLWFFLPETSVAKNARFQQVLASRFLSEAGQQALAYGALVAVARSGGSAMELALIGVAGLLPAAALGLYGGAVADALPKRVALAVIYNLQAAFCFIVPLVVGSDLLPVLMLIFAVNALGQVSTPSESAVVPFVATQEQLASAASFVNLAASAGAGVGTALLAPIIVRVFGTAPVLYLSGVLLLLAGSRVFDLATQEPERAIAWAIPKVRAIDTLRWLARQPAVTAMIAVGVVASTVNVVLQTLAPRYVVDVLHVDAANAVYVFGASAAGLALALAIAPGAMKRSGERLTALVGFLIAALALVLLGLVGEISVVLDNVNPIRLLEVFGIDIGDELRTAALLALPVGFGVALATTAVQTYVNRRVPLDYQGRAFALQGSLRAGVAIVPLLALAGAASAFGVERVLVVSPFLLLALAYGLVLLSIRFAGLAPPSNLEVLSSFWEQHEDSPAPP